jgi:hypothetical protein
VSCRKVKPVPEVVVIRIFEVQVVRAIIRESVVTIKTQISHSSPDLELQRVKVRLPVGLPKCRIHELREGSPAVCKRYVAGLWLVDIQAVVEPSAARADVGNSESEVSYLLLDTNLPVSSFANSEVELILDCNPRQNLLKPFDLDGQRIGHKLIGSLQNLIGFA